MSAAMGGPLRRDDRSVEESSGNGVSRITGYRGIGRWKYSIRDWVVGECLLSGRTVGVLCVVGRHVCAMLSVLDTYPEVWTGAYIRYWYNLDAEYDSSKGL